MLILLCMGMNSPCWRLPNITTLNFRVGKHSCSNRVCRYRVTPCTIRCRMSACQVEYILSNIQCVTIRIMFFLPDTHNGKGKRNMQIEIFFSAILFAMMEVLRTQFSQAYGMPTGGSDRHRAIPTQRLHRIRRFCGVFSDDHAW